MRPKLTRREFSSMLACLGLGAATPAWGESKEPMPFKLGIITDEITQEFEQALDFISHYSLSHCELRDLWKKNIMNASSEDLERARQLIEKHHLLVSDIASPIFNYDLPEVPAHDEKTDAFGAQFTDKDSER